MALTYAREEMARGALSDARRRDRRPVGCPRVGRRAALLPTGTTPVGTRGAVRHRVRRGATKARNAPLSSGGARLGQVELVPPRRGNPTGGARLRRAVESSSEPLPSGPNHGSPTYAYGFGAVDGLSRRSESEGGAEPRPTLTRRCKDTGRGLQARTEALQDCQATERTSKRKTQRGHGLPRWVVTQQPTDSTSPEPP